MKLVVNICFGGFNLPDDVMEELGYIFADDPNIRGDLRLIKMVEENPERFEFNYTKLRVVEIPSAATDYEINEYDGLETVTYVLDGKIEHVC